MESLNNICIHPFFEAYQQNGKIFACHSDLIKLLGWNSDRYTRDVKAQAKSKEQDWETGTSDNGRDRFPVQK